MEESQGQKASWCCLNSRSRRKCQRRMKKFQVPTGKCRGRQSSGREKGQGQAQTQRDTWSCFLGLAAVRGCPGNETARVSRLGHVVCDGGAVPIRKGQVLSLFVLPSFRGSETYSTDTSGYEKIR